MAIGDTHVRPSHESPFQYDVCIIGLGYVGLHTALTYFASGLSVLGIDASADRLISVGAGMADLTDADREQLDQALTDDRFQMTADHATLGEARAVIICVPAPVNEYFAPDLNPLKRACATVTQHARPGQLLILTSTTYVGCTHELLVRPLAKRGLEVGQDVHVAFCAELIESDSTTGGPDIRSFVVGGAMPTCAQRAVETLHVHTASVDEVPSLAIAEMAKLLENTFRAVSTAVANDFADIRRSMKVDT
ncbi:hypothetical protein [Aeromicrobium sp. 9AM]|uniref:hypothetical protein n=1 Tax=Aeromicrobium sp. 9AM TaxID=2653126 RepID=UPI0012F3EAA5